MSHPLHVIIIFVLLAICGKEDFGEDTEYDEPEDPEEGVVDEGWKVEGGYEAWGAGEEDGKEHVD